jgi:hypothetical protein
MGSFLKSRSGRIVSVVAAVLVLYTLAGFFVAPRVVRSLIIDKVHDTLGLTPQVGEVDFNPLRLHLEIHDFSLPGADGAKLVGFRRFAVSVGGSSLWRRALVLSDVEIEAPTVDALIDREGRINLLQLKPKTPSQPSDPDQPLPRIDVGMFRVSGGTVSFTDRSRSPEFSTRLEPIEFDLHDFTTGSDGGQFDFSATTQNAERIGWHGHLSVAPLESDGEITVAGLKARTLWDYVESQVGFAVSGGELGLSARYRASLQGSTEVRVDLVRLTASGLGVRPKGGDTDWISLPELTVGPASLDLARHELNVDAVTLKGLKVSASLASDRSLNLMQLARGPAAPAAPAAAAGHAVPPAPAAAPGAAAAAAAGTPASAWHLSLKEFTLQDAALRLEDHGVSPATAFTLQPFSVAVQGASLDLAQPLNVRLTSGINGSGQLSVTGSVTPSPLASDLAVQLDGFDLSVLQPYIGQATGLILQSGVLGANLKVRYGAARPQVTVAGGVSIGNLHTVDRQLHDDFLNWQSLELKGLNYQQQPARLELDRVTVRKLYSRAIIEADETLNVQRVLSPGGVLPAAKSTAAKSAAAPAAGPAPATAPAKAAVARTGPSTFVAIHTIEIDDSAVNFSDLSVTPNFSAGIRKFGGTVTGLSSQPGSRAQVDLKGEVDAFSPVTIAGELNVLSPAMYADVSMSFRNISLAIMNPYSGKFAGYNISKGKLTADMHYRIDGRKLNADHHIVIDQLEFGDKTDSKEAVSLPIKLAVSLLKDRNGVIDLPLPVNGSLDDPQFRLAPIIWKVLVQTLEKAVVAPFALLASLFSAGPDLQFIDFAPGSADVDAQAKEHLQTIAKALGERPQLKLDLPIAYVKAADAPALAAAKLAAQLQAAVATKPGAAAVAFAQLDPGVQLKLLHGLYVATVGAEPQYPDAIAAIKAKADADAARRDYLRQELLARESVTPDELLKLGQHRARALQDALLTGSTLDPERVFLVESDRAKLEGDRVRLEMSLH